MVGSNPQIETIQQLTQQLRQMEQSRQSSSDGDTLLTTGIEPLDRLLPEGGFRRGTIIEWLADGPGTGAATLALMTARQAIQAGGALVVIDLRQEFYPPAAAHLGIDLNNTIIVRPDKSDDALWAWEQSLRCRGVAVTFGWIEGLHDRAFRRLQLAAEAGGGLGLLIRPSKARRQPSWAEARLLIQPLPSPPSTAGRRLQIELLHGRGSNIGQSLQLEINDETGDVHLAAELAPATRSERV